MEIRSRPGAQVPAHTLSWARGIPEVVVPCDYVADGAASASDSAALDPTSERTYEVVESVIDAVSDIFPDAHFHVGADEVRAECWDREPRLRAWAKRRGLGRGDARDLFAHFLERVLDIVARHKRRPVVWQDGLELATPAAAAALARHDAVVETWKCWSGSADRWARAALAKNLSVVDASCWFPGRAETSG